MNSKRSPLMDPLLRAGAVLEHGQELGHDDGLGHGHDLGHGEESGHGDESGHREELGQGHNSDGQQFVDSEEALRMIACFDGAFSKDCNGGRSKS